MRVHWCALCRSDSDTPDQWSCKRARQRKRNAFSLSGRNAPHDKMGRGSTYKSHKEIQVCRLSLCCQSRDTRGTLCKRNAWGTQLADVYGRRCISAKYHKTKTPKRHYERISRREREENNDICTLYLLGAITYEKEFLLCVDVVYT